MPDLCSALASAYREVGAFESDLVYLYSDLRALGRLAPDVSRKASICNAVAAPLIDAGKTVIIATFSYTADGVFEVRETPTALGAMNKWVLAQSAVERSEHPLFSYAALGPSASFLRDIGKSAFGHDSLFCRLKGRRAAFLHVGRPVWMGNTALHHVEHVGGASYRAHKVFRTRVHREGQFIGTDFSAFVRRRDVPGESFEFSFVRSARAIRSAGLVKEVGREVDFTNISCMSYDATVELLHKLFEQDPTVFINSDFRQY